MRRIAIMIGVATLVLAAAAPALANGPGEHGAPDNPGGGHGAPENRGGDRGVSADQPAPKVDVCHFSSDAQSFHLINISAHALDADIAHGDALAGTSVPGMDNYEFDEACEIPSIQVVDGSFTDATLDVGFTAYLAFDDAVSGIGYYSFSGNVGDMTVTDYCLDAMVASVWGPGTSAINGDGFWVLTLIDDGGGSMSTRALFFDDDVANAETDAEAAFNDQCADKTFGRSGGTGSLTFGP